MTVIEIVREYLEKNGYDGLCQEDEECGCGLDDFVPCDNADFMNCEAGYKVPCNCGEGCDFHISTKKPSEVLK